MKHVVSISDAKVSNNPEDTLVTYSLGSCIGVTMYDPVTKAGGLLHYQLPSSSINPDRAKKIPCMFADTGMLWLIKAITAAGADKKRIKVSIAGAAEMMSDKNMFNIGKRNHAAIRKILWTNGMFIDNDDTGGKSPRTVYLHLADGSIEIASQKAKVLL